MVDVGGAGDVDGDGHLHSVDHLGVVAADSGLGTVGCSLYL